MLGPLTAYLGISFSRFYPSVSAACVLVLPNCCARWLNTGDLWVITLVYLHDGFGSQLERTSAVAAFIQHKELDSSGLLVNEEKSH